MILIANQKFYEADQANESNQLAGQLKVSEDQIDAAIRHFDETLQLMAKYCWRIPRIQNNPKGGLSVASFQALREALVMNSNYLQLLLDRDHLLMLGEIYYDVLKGK